MVTMNRRATMEHIEEVYKTLTGVDIQKQQALWDERGKGYYGEFLVFKELYPHLPGNCKILMNINLPISPHKTTEIDLLLLHETGAYVFEMKHYKGTIYGQTTEPRWTQYFRTTANHAFRNPIEQNRYHIQALQSRYPGLPIHSFIVFTSPECDLKVECNEPYITVCRLAMLSYHISILTKRPHVMGMDQIDDLFRDLMRFSPIMQESVPTNAAPVPFHEYAMALAEQYKESLAQQEECYRQNTETLKADCQHKIAQAETSCQAITRQSKRRSRSSILVASAICIGSILFSFFICNTHQAICDKQVQDAQTELSRFAQKFERVDDWEKGDFTMSKDFISVPKMHLSNSTEREGSIIFGFSLACDGEYYCAAITRNTTLSVVLRDGSLREFTLPDDYFPYSFSIIKSGNFVITNFIVSYKFIPLLKITFITVF